MAGCPHFYPKLRFDGITMCSSRCIPGSEQYTKEFIQNVDAVLQQHNGEFVGDFKVKFELSSELVIHLDKWVRFVVASQAKNVALDLMPAKFRGCYDRYLLPHELLDSGSTRRLLNIQLRFVSIKLPSEFNAMKLDTFVCGGSLHPFDLTQSLELKDAHFHVHDLLTLDYALVTLPTVLPSVENLCLQATAPLKTPALLEKAIKFSRLKYLQLELFMSYEYAGNILSLATFFHWHLTCRQLLLLKFKIHFSVFSFAHSVLDLEPLKSLPRCPNNYLKTLYITGFTVCRGQLEFLLYTVENAPVLEVLTLDPACKFDERMPFERQALVFSVVREVSKLHLTGRMSPTTKLCPL